MTNKEFAEFLLPGVKHTWQEYEECIQKEI